MSKPNSLRRAPAILKRRLQPPPGQVAGASTCAPPAAPKRPLVIEVQLENSPQSGYFFEPVNVQHPCVTGDIATGNLENHAATTIAPVWTTAPVAGRAISNRNLTPKIAEGRGPYGRDGRNVFQRAEFFEEDKRGMGCPDDLDLWDIDVNIEDGVRLKDSVSTQVDFPSRALAALSRQLIEQCGKVSPTLASRAVREDLIEKLTQIVDDAGNSPKARFLLEQILAYKSKISHHSSFMAHHAKILMEISPKAYTHLKCVEGTGLVSLPCKSTLRSRYPGAAYVPAPAVNPPVQIHQQPHMVSGVTGSVGEQVVLEVTDAPDPDGAQGLEVETEDAVGTVAIHEVVGQTPTYYYVVPGGDDNILLSNVIMDHHVDPEPT